MEKLTRRQLLLGTVSAGGAGLLSLWCGGRAAAQTNMFLPDGDVNGKFSYFTQAEIAFVNAALDRLIPSDALGTGARESGGTWFIDQQLAGPFGRAERWYMQGPWRDGTDEQGYQLKYTPAQLYRAAIQSIDEYCRHDMPARALHNLTQVLRTRSCMGWKAVTFSSRRHRARSFSRCCCRMPERASSPIPCTVAISSSQAGS